MTTYLYERRTVHQARQYRPTHSESSATSLTGWIEGAVHNAQVTATVNATSFSITTVTDVDGSETITGAPGDWIVITPGNSPRVISDDGLLDGFEIALA